jgi:hypothetical protein
MLETKNLMGFTARDAGGKAIIKYRDFQCCGEGRAEVSPNVIL